MSWTRFYNEALHLGNVFGIKGVFYGPKGHLGVDFNNHPIGTPIPSWTAGVVVVNTFYRTLGWTVIIKRADGTFAGFCHMQKKSPLAVGSRVAVGQIVGLLGNSGIFTTGAHTHFTLEPQAAIGTAKARDPLPHIRAAVKAALNPASKTLESDMKVIKRTDGTEEWSLIHPSLVGDTALEQGYLVTTDANRAKQWERTWENGQGSADPLSRADYIAQQDEARSVRKQWLKGQPVGAVVDPVVIAKAVNDELARRVAQ